MQDIHDIKPLLGMDFPWFSAGAALLLLLGLLLLAVWAWRRWRRHRQPPAAPPEPAPPRVDHREAALRALKQLKPDATPPGQFYLQLEKVLKEFLEGLHQQPITGFTAEQLQQFLADKPVPEAFDQLLQHGRQAKFAAMPLGSEQMQADLQQTQSFVRTYTQN